MPRGIYIRTKQHGVNIGIAKQGKRTSITTEFKKGHPKFGNGSLGKHWRLTKEQKKKLWKYSINKQKLIDLYWHQKLSINKIANYFKCSEKVIFSRMKEYNISRRSLSEALVGKFVSQKTRDKHSIRMQKRTGDNSPNWKNGISKNKDYKKNLLRKYYQKYKINPNYRLKRSMGNAVHKALKQNKKGRNWEYLVGYTLKQLKQRLECQFQKGMSWKNYGKWHVDHKKPQSLFKYNTPEDQAFKNSWSLANLQPLWATDNLHKHNKF